MSFKLEQLNNWTNDLTKVRKGFLSGLDHKVDIEDLMAEFETIATIYGYVTYYLSEVEEDITVDLKTNDVHLTAKEEINQTKDLFKDILTKAYY